MPKRVTKWQLNRARNALKITLLTKARTTLDTTRLDTPRMRDAGISTCSHHYTTRKLVCLAYAYSIQNKSGERTQVRSHAEYVSTCYVHEQQLL